VVQKAGIRRFFIVGLARLANRFLLLVQKKSVKEKDTPCHAPSGFPALLAGAGGLRNSPWQATQTVACCGAQTVRAEIPRPACAARRGSRGK